MFDCTTDTYETLYARWLQKPGELLDWAGYEPLRWGEKLGEKPRGHRLLDLCGGTGAIAKEAVRRGADHVHVLDLKPRLSREETFVEGRRRIYLLSGRAEDLRGTGGWTAKFNPLECDECWYPYNPTPDRRHDTPWDLIVCRQAMGYLDLRRLEPALRSVLVPGGRFVCNNFVQPKWSFQRYEYQGKWFVEASGYVGRRVFHLQAMDGDFDVTTFRWHTPEEIEQAFSKPYWALGRREITSRSARFSFVRCA